MDAGTVPFLPEKSNVSVRIAVRSTYARPTTATTARRCRTVARKAGMMGPVPVTDISRAESPDREAIRRHAPPCDRRPVP